MLENAIEHLTDIDRWWHNFDYINEATEEELEQMKRAHQEMQQAVLKAAWTSEEAAEMLAIREEMRRLDQIQYENELQAKGEAKGKAGLINMLLKGGMAIHDIAKHTGLPLQEIEKLLAKYS
jgi:predicted transposase/invertase (TIGR01784 family)